MTDFIMTGITFEVPYEHRYAPTSVEVAGINYGLSWDWYTDPLGRYNYGIVTSSFSASDNVSAKTKSKDIAIAIAHDQSSSMPYQVAITGGDVIYRSLKTDQEIEANDICPICYSKIFNQNGTGEQTWSSDPIKTPHGLAGQRFVGFQNIKRSDIVAIQTRNNLALTADFTDISSGYQQISKNHIAELRTSTEAILNATGQTKGEYFNYDEDSVDMESNQADWHNTNLDSYKGDVQALHIEDLRHFLQTVGQGILAFYEIDGDFESEGMCKFSQTSDTIALGNEYTVPGNLFSVSRITGEVSWLSQTHCLYLERIWDGSWYVPRLSKLEIIEGPPSRTEVVASFDSPSEDVELINVFCQGEIIYAIGKQSDSETIGGVSHSQEYIYMYQLNTDLELQSTVIIQVGLEDSGSGVTSTAQIGEGNPICIDQDYLYILTKTNKSSDGSTSPTAETQVDPVSGLTYTTYIYHRWTELFDPPAGPGILDLVTAEQIADSYFKEYIHTINPIHLLVNTYFGFRAWYDMKYWVQNKYGIPTAQGYTGASGGWYGGGYSDDGTYFPATLPVYQIQKYRLSTGVLVDTLNLTSTSTNDRGDTINYLLGGTTVPVPNQNISLACDEDELYVLMTETTLEDNPDLSPENSSPFFYTNEFLTVRRINKTDESLYGWEHVVTLSRTSDEDNHLHAGTLGLTRTKVLFTYHKQQLYTQYDYTYCYKMKNTSTIYTLPIPSLGIRPESFVFATQYVTTFGEVVEE